MAMTRQNRILIGIAAIILVGLGLVYLIARLTLSGVPNIEALTPVVTAMPSKTRPPSTATATEVESDEPTATTSSTPRPTRTANVQVTGGANISSIQATASALAESLETPPSLDGPTPTTESVEVPSAEFTPTNQDTTAGDEPTTTPPATPIEIAFAPVLIRSNVSGDVIGDGTLRLYAPSSVQDAQTVRVELELNVDNAYITPTPQGSDRTAVPRSTQVSSPPGTTPTPYVPVITDQGLPIYQRMGATLLCSAASFSGCDGQRDPTQTKLISSRSTSWSWILRPAEAVSGVQDLRLEVWITQLNLDGQIEFLDVPDAQYRFTIAVNPAGGISPILISLVVVASSLLVVGGVLWRKRRGGQTPPAIKIPSTVKSPMVFISYRRGSSWGQARSIEQSLRKRGADVFIDIDDINEGKFAETIQKAIADCDFFLPVLAPRTLDSEWVRREIAHAIQLKKTIVPLLVDGFMLDAESLPADITEIASHNAIRVLPEFYEEAMDRLAKRFLRLE
jgi:hypothetical protein